MFASSARCVPVIEISRIKQLAEHRQCTALLVVDELQPREIDRLPVVWFARVRDRAGCATVPGARVDLAVIARPKTPMSTTRVDRAHHRAW